MSRNHKLSTSVLKRKHTLFRITKDDGTSEYQYIPNNDRNIFFKWSKDLRVGDYYRKSNANKFINDYFNTNVNYVKIEHILRQEEIDILYNEFLEYIQSSKKIMGKCKRSSANPIRDVFNDWWAIRGGDMNWLDMPFNMEVYWKTLQEPKIYEILNIK
jgi:hypothetical protein